MATQSAKGFGLDAVCKNVTGLHCDYEDIVSRISENIMGIVGFGNF
jgi:hypothetical protein